MNKIKSCMICVLLVLMGCTYYGSEAAIKKIDSDEALNLMEEGAVLLDVRMKSEYLKGHIEGSILLTLDEIETAVADVIPDQDRAIIVYCRSGNRSSTAAKTLIKLGYKNVYDLGSINNWKYEIVN